MKTQTKLTSVKILKGLYDQFKFKTGVDGRYFWWLCKSKYFTDIVRSCAHGVVKEKMVFKRDKFLEKEIPLLKIDKQKKKI